MSTAVLRRGQTMPVALAAVTPAAGAPTDIKLRLVPARITGLSRGDRP
jgi:hypothetical protein